MSTTLAQRLYELRRASGISQEDLARKLGVSRQAVSKWECGESVPGTDNLIALARLYGVELGALVGIEQEEPNGVPVAQDAVETPGDGADAANDGAEPSNTPSAPPEPDAPRRRRRTLALILCGAAAVLLALVLIYCVRANTPDYIVVEGTVVAVDDVRGDFVIDIGYTEQFPSRYIVCGVDSNTAYSSDSPEDAETEDMLASREPIELQEGWRVRVRFDVRGGKPWPEVRNLADSIGFIDEGGA